MPPSGVSAPEAALRASFSDDWPIALDAAELELRTCRAKRVPALLLPLRGLSSRASSARAVAVMGFFPEKALFQKLVPEAGW